MKKHLTKLIITIIALSSFGCLKNEIKKDEYLCSLEYSLEKEEYSCIKSSTANYISIPKANCNNKIDYNYDGIKKAKWPKELKKHLPKGYHRIEFKKKKYQTMYFSFKDSDFSFEVSKHFDISSVNQKINEEEYLEIKLENSQHNFGFVLNYRPIKNNLEQLIKESYNQQLLELATGTNPKMSQDGKSYKVEIYGPVANPYMFHTTDKINHFLHGMMFICSDPKKKCDINIDSLRPIIKYFEEDMENIIKTIKWSN